MDYIAEGIGSRAWQYHVSQISHNFLIRKLTFDRFSP